MTRMLFSRLCDAIMTVKPYLNNSDAIPSPNPDVEPVTIAIKKKIHHIQKIHHLSRANITTVGGSVSTKIYLSGVVTDSLKIA